MPTATTTLFYGLFVSAPSLVFAAEAHHQLQPTFLALDLISLRRRQGALEVSGLSSESALLNMPDEIWQMVRGCLIVEELVLAEKRILLEVQAPCEGCKHAGCGVHKPWKTWGMPPCICRTCPVTLSRRAMGALNGVSGARILTLLAPYGLSTPTARTLPHRTGDFRPSVPVSLPLCSKGSISSSPNTDVQADGDRKSSATSVADLSPEAIAFAESPSATRRFASLINTWRLEVAVESENGLIPPTELQGGSRSTVGKLEPGWMLWVTAQPDE